MTAFLYCILLFYELMRYKITNNTKKIVKFILRHDILSNCFGKNTKMSFTELFGNISLENFLRVYLLTFRKFIMKI